MKPLYTQEQFKSSKSNEKLPCECYQCGETFYKQKKEINAFLKENTRRSIKFCSLRCVGLSKRSMQNVSCVNCGTTFKKKPSEIQRSPNHFCSKSCSGTYNNKNKKYGIRRSKLEVWLEEQLTILYPELEVHYNRKDTIGSELDIFIPSLNLAVELNGIFHYEPIFGVNKLQKIQENDQSKTKACIEHKIDLCIIDVSAFKHFKPARAQKYLDIITNIINDRSRF